MEIENCPCCRGIAAVGFTEVPRVSYSPGQATEPIRQYFAVCTACGLNNCGPGRRGGFDTREEAIIAWNQRFEYNIANGKLMILIDALGELGIPVEKGFYANGPDPESKYQELLDYVTKGENDDGIHHGIRSVRR